jgi:hypothetical protein
MLSSLLFRENYTRFYDNRYLSLFNTIDLANGLTLRTRLTYQDWRQETNHSNYSFFFTHTRQYYPNVPDNPQTATHPETLAGGIDFVSDLALAYTPEYYYRMFGHRKYMVRSSYPTLTLRWQRGWNGVFRSNSRFDLLSLGLSQHVRIHSESTFRYAVEGGNFFTNDQMGFQWFRHFPSNAAGVSFGTFTNAYQLLPLYRHSTDKWFVTAHAEYTALFLALKYVPFLSNVLMNERLSVAYLHTPQLPHYSEWGYSLTDIYFLGEVGVFIGLEGLKYHAWGFRAAIKLDSFR